MNNDMIRPLGRYDIEVIKRGLDTAKNLPMPDPNLVRVMIEQTRLASVLVQQVDAMHESLMATVDLSALIARNVVNPTMSSTFLNYASAASQALRTVDVEAIGKAALAAGKEARRQQEMWDLLEPLGLIVSPSMGRNLENRLVKAAKEGKTADELWAIVDEACSDRNFRVLRDIVGRLTCNQDFMRWKGTLDQVLECHVRGFDKVTTASLVPVIEGVCVPLLEEEVLPALGRGGKVGHNRIAVKIEDVEVALPVYAVAGFFTALSYMENHLYASFDWREDRVGRHDDTNANRHQITHGMVAGNRRNTLRCFLILDVLADILPAIRKAAGL